MTNYKSYHKIYNLYKEEADGILDGEVVVQCKVDGANVAIYQKDGIVRCGTRTRELPLDESFRGLQEHVRSNSRLMMYFSRNPNYILYAEWLVRHSILYTQDHYNKLYLFDIYDTDKKEFLDQEDVEAEAEFLGLEYPIVYGRGKFTIEDLDEFIAQEWLGAKNEGVVIKPLNFVNKFGDRVYAKKVSQAFKEKNAIVFGGNDKHSEYYWEQYVTNKYCTIATLEKNLNKIAPEIGRLDKSHTPRVANTCVHDTITENIWEIFKKTPKLNFKKLNNLMMRKYIQLYHDKLENSYSVADLNKKEKTNE